MTNPLKFDPAKVTYAFRYRRHSHIKKDGTKYVGPKNGPYWYASELHPEQGLKTYYIGKELPEECIPYVPKVLYTGGPVMGKRGNPFKKRRGASDTILEALDRGEQVVLDVKQIAEDCKAYVDSLGGYRYLLYRDPIEKKE